MDGIIYNTNFKAQSYLSDKNINPSLAKLLFKFRCRMINVKMNFKRTYSEFNCPLCLKNVEFHSDSQQNILTCTVLKQYSTVLANNKTVMYEHIFSANTEQMIGAVKLLKIALKIRTDLLNKDDLVNTDNSV